MDPKVAGYTHEIKYLKYCDSFNLYVPSSFPTTADAVELHVQGLISRGENVKNIKVFDLVTGLRVDIATARRSNMDTLHVV